MFILDCSVIVSSINKLRAIMCSSDRITSTSCFALDSFFLLVQTEKLCGGSTFTDEFLTLLAEEE